MSTNNNAAQTLFRFVSLRNPKLTETKNKNFAFIQRPEDISGPFDEAVENRGTLAKQVAMASTLENFEPQAFKSVKNLEEGTYAQLFQIGKKISKKETLDPQDWEVASEYYRNNDMSGKFTELWNNLIY